jgi:nucleotide-binding universal stress UspA family protein
MKESERGYDAIFAGASRMEGDYALSGEVLRELVSQARTPVIIARNIGTPMPMRQVLVPTTGAPFARLGATLAMLYANATNAGITALYVKESPLVSLRSLYPGRLDAAANVTPITNEIRAFGQQLGVNVAAHATSGSKPEKAILLAAERGSVDLLVMSVQVRPTERGLYFGPKLEHILRNLRYAVAVVVTPEAALRH